MSPAPDVSAALPALAGSGTLVSYDVANAPGTQLELVISQARSTVPVRVVLAKRLTTLGSNPAADVCLPMLAEQWAMVTQHEAGATVRVLTTGTDYQLADGSHIEVDGVSLALTIRRGDGDGIGAHVLAEALSSADTPATALEQICAGLVAATGADSGAIILRDGNGYSVVAARDAAGGALSEAAILLSDTVVLDVLGGATTVALGDVAHHDRYANIASVVRLQLRSVLCVPMAAGDRVLGAIFLGKRDMRAPFTDTQARELRVLAAMSVPFLAQMRRRASSSVESLTQLVGESPVMVETRRLIDRVGPSDLGVVIKGETGTGKERCARALHAASPRAHNRMVALNCAAVPASLLEAELFGYKKGAFTGATTDRAGRLEQADGSTLFLDEIGDMPAAMQAALLRVLQEREVTRIGENEPRKVDFRCLVATHRDLDEEVAANRFRADLLFRLREITIELPPLRQRDDDVILLAHLFLRQAEQQLSLAPHGLASSAEQVLKTYDWPGNVRELRSVMRRAAVLCDGSQITGADLGLGLASDAAIAIADSATAGAGGGLGDLSRPLAEARDDFISRYVAAAVEMCGGDRQRAAESLGISVRSLYRYL